MYENFKNVVRLPKELEVTDETTQYKFGWARLADIINYILAMEVSVADQTADNNKSVYLFFVKSYRPKWERSTLSV